MIKSLLGQVLNAALLFFLYSPSLSGQDTDHLAMQLNFDGPVLEVRATYTAIVKDSGASMYFLLNPAFELGEISATGLDTFALGQKPERPFPFWRLDFDRVLKVGEEATVKFDYHINLEELNHLRSNWIELNVDKLWFPKYDDMDREFTYEVSITGFPDSFGLVGHTDAFLERKDSFISITHPEPALEVLILAGGDMRKWQSGDSITFFAHQSIPDSVLESMHTKVSNSIGLLNQAFGASGPITSFRVVLRNTPRKELGYQYSRGNMIVTGTDFNDYGNLSHEIAHYWWTGADFIKEPWLNESFANYSMFLVMETFAPEEYEKLFERYRKKAEQAPPVADATLFSPDAYDAYYIKGSVLLKQLEDKVGKEKMVELLRLRAEKGVKTTEGVLALLENISDRETREYFESLLQE